MRIHATYTGRIISMVDSPSGLASDTGLKGWLYSLIAGIEFEGWMSLTRLKPLIDSSNATPEPWQTIINNLYIHREEVDPFVVLHGTGTMSYSNAALFYALIDLDRPAVFTGAQYPSGDVGSDTTGDVADALHTVTSGWTRGVSLLFGHHPLTGSCVTKTSS